MRVVLCRTAFGGVIQTLGKSGNPPIGDDDTDMKPTSGEQTLRMSERQQSLTTLHHEYRSGLCDLLADIIHTFRERH